MGQYGVAAVFFNQGRLPITPLAATLLTLHLSEPSRYIFADTKLTVASSEIPAFV